MEGVRGRPDLLISDGVLGLEVEPEGVLGLSLVVRDGGGSIEMDTGRLGTLEVELRALLCMVVELVLLCITDGRTGLPQPLATGYTPSTGRSLLLLPVIDEHRDISNEDHDGMDHPKHTRMSFHSLITHTVSLFT